jgi:hypothetical protein
MKVQPLFHVIYAATVIDTIPHQLQLVLHKSQPAMIAIDMNNHNWCWLWLMQYCIDHNHY